MEGNKSNSLNFAEIAPYQGRQFVPCDADLSNVGQVVGLYNKLLEREIASVKELEALLLDRSEFEAALDQHKAVLYIRMTCQTDDPARAQAYKSFTETILPAMKPLADELDRKYLDACKNISLDEKRYEVYDRSVRTDVELFRQENVALQTKEELLSQEYQAVRGTMTVTFQGQEYTIPEMRKFLEQTDRSLRESAWRARANRLLQDAERLDEIFDKMLGLRQQIAANAGFENYSDYKFREYHRFDYTVNDCRQYHGAVEKLVVPVLARIYKQRKKEMNLSSLRPWDLDVDAQGREPLRPFERIDEYLKGSKEIFSRIDPELGSQFQEMIDLGLLDVGSRKGKAPGGYQENLSEARKPFIFGNAVGTDDNLRLILHEGGHAFHSFACAGDPLLNYRHAPIEFCEVASMSMELLARKHLGVFYSEEDADRSRRVQLEFIVFILAWVGTIDAFQHWLYENPNHSLDERRDAWLGIYRHSAAVLSIGRA